MSFLKFFRKIDDAMWVFADTLNAGSAKMLKASEDMKLRAQIFNAEESAVTLKRMLELKSEMGAPEQELADIRQQIDDCVRIAASLRNDIS